MAGFMKIEGFDGEATDKKHDKWIIISSVAAGAHRSIPEGAKDAQRSRGQTTIQDVIVHREMDKSSVKLKEACATGKHLDEVLINLTNEVGGQSEPYLKYKLKDVIITSYTFQANASGTPLPSEEITLNYHAGEWTYVEFDNAKGTPKGNVVGKYEPSKHATS